MEKVSVFNQSGQKIGEQELSPEIFHIVVRPEVIHQVVVAQQANVRQVLAHTKGRGEVRGGGKKPWKQKGTGRARHGSIRSPIWVGGGITFGPTKERNFSKKINKQIRKQALKMVLSDKAEKGSFFIIDSLIFPDKKTKILATLVNTLSLAEKKILFIGTKEEKGVLQMCNNIPLINALSVENLNTIDILKNEFLLLSKVAFHELEEKLKV